MNKKATMVYLLRDNQVLFLVRKKKNDTTHKQGMYLSIGGKIEPGESILESAIREIREESTIEVSNLELRGVLHFVNWGADRHDWVDFVFVGSDFKGDPQNGNEGSFEWVNQDSLENIPLYESNKQFLPEILKSNFVVMEYIYDGDFEPKKQNILAKFPIRDKGSL